MCICYFHSFPAAKSKENIESDSPVDEQLFTKPLFSTVYGDKIKKQPFIESQDDDWTEAKFQRMFQKLSEPLGYTADLTVEFAAKSKEDKSRRYGTSLVYGIGEHGLSHRANLMMQKQVEETSGEDNFVLCMEMEANLPRPAIIRREDFVRDDLSRTSSVKIGFGKSCTDDRKILITVAEFDISTQFHFYFKSHKSNPIKLLTIIIIAQQSTRYPLNIPEISCIQEMTYRYL